MFFHLINNSELKDKAYNYMFSLCDGVSFLYSDYNNTSDFSTDLIGTEYENLYNHLISTHVGESWGMGGTICKFTLSDHIKNLIKTFRLDGRIKITNTNALENLELFKGDKCLYSICSHEGYEEIDDAFCNKVSAFCLNEIENTPTYKELYLKYSNISFDLEKINSDLSILKDINAYVEDAWQRVIRIAPQKEATYEEFLSLARTYLTNKTILELEKHSNFKTLYLSGYPQTFEQVKDYTNRETFISSPLYAKVMEEIDILDVILYKKQGFKTNSTNHCPTIIVNEDK